MKKANDIQKKQKAFYALIWYFRWIQTLYFLLLPYRMGSFAGRINPIDLSTLNNIASDFIKRRTCFNVRYKTNK